MRKLSVVVSAVAVLAVVSVAAFTLGGRRAAKQEQSQQNAAAESDALNKSTAAKTNARTPVVVELFTSEGCSSCPPADALLARLDETQPVGGAEVIPLAMHVDYWNDLGWADPFSSAQFSERQGEYAAAFGHDGVYTPQMIVDGVKEFAGGNERAALEALNNAAREPKPEVKLAREATRPGDVSQPGDAARSVESARINVEIDKLPKRTEGDAVYVLLALTESGLSSDVARGENSGRRLTHVGVVRVLKTLGGLTDAGGGAFRTEAVVPLEKSWRRENLRAVVFAQERGTRRVLAAASLKLFG
ncbi:MAG TPA: DUF1223 domain-containing protein [Pyrinomonadaceae bacterium]|nr:DUF1223 domain-containing protein [Pyrinomonadaceae bacterium]